MTTEEAADVIAQGVGDRAKDTSDVLAALAEERVGSLGRCVGAQLSVETELLAGGPKQRGDDGREREHQEQAVASRWLLDAHVSEAETEAPILVVSEGLLDPPGALRR